MSFNLNQPGQLVYDRLSVIQKQKLWFDSFSSVSCRLEMVTLHKPIPCCSVHEYEDAGKSPTVASQSNSVPSAGAASPLTELCGWRDSAHQDTRQWWGVRGIPDETAESSDPENICLQDTRTAVASGNSRTNGSKIKKRSLACLIRTSAGLKWHGKLWCFPCLPQRAMKKTVSADVNLLCVRAPVHSSVSLPWYYIPVCFSKGSPVTSHLGRDARELWKHRAEGLGHAPASRSWAPPVSKTNSECWKWSFSAGWKSWITIKKKKNNNRNNGGIIHKINYDIEYRYKFKSTIFTWSVASVRKSNCSNKARDGVKK